MGVRSKGRPGRPVISGDVLMEQAHKAPSVTDGKQATAFAFVSALKPTKQ